MEQAVTYLFLGVGIAMFNFAALQLTARRKSSVNRALCVLFFSLGYIWLYYGLYRYNRLAAAPWLLYSDVAVTFLIGPLLYFYVRNLAGGSLLPVRRRALMFLPALTVLLYLIWFRPFAAVDITQLPGPYPDHFRVPAVRVLNTLADTHFFFHVLAGTLVLVGILRRGDYQFRRHFIGVLVYFINSLLTFFVFFAGHLLANENLLGIAVLANGINSIYFFFLSYRYPEYTQKRIRSAQRDKNAPENLKGVNIQKILTELGKVIDGEKGYRDPTISLQSLSMQLGIQHHQLSRILNEYMGTNFRHYINQHRLNDAKQLLVEAPQMSILDIAFTVGFNSKSAFNADFLKATGAVPSEYRKKHMKKVPKS